MIESLRKLDRKFLIFIGCLILIPLLLIVILVMAQGCSRGKNNYTKYEFKMETAAKKYLSEKDLLPSESGEYVVAPLDALVEQSYIESPSKVIGDNTCTGYVGVRKDKKLNYRAVLTCDSYKTSTLTETLKNDLVTEGEGLYETKDGYIYRGLNVNNYLKMGNEEYRIIGITNKNIIKIYKVESESLQLYWDSKYNINTQSNTGVNIYKDSYMVENFNNYIQTSSKFKRIKSHLVTDDVCVHSKKLDDRFMGETCKEVVSDQYITLLGLEDFMNASLDPNCVDLYSKSCRNYNYLGRIGVYTWTKDIVSDNNYQVYYMSNGTPIAENTNIYEGYNFVMFIDGDMVTATGSGTKAKPYVIK